jgi:hypothetical protein
VANQESSLSLGLIDILKLYGFDPALGTRVVRHEDSEHEKIYE